MGGHVLKLLYFVADIGAKNDAKATTQAFAESLKCFGWIREKYPVNAPEEIWELVRAVAMLRIRSLRLKNDSLKR